MFIPRKIPAELIPALMAGAVGQVVQEQPVFFMEDGDDDLFREDTSLELCIAAVQRLSCFDEKDRRLLPSYFLRELGAVLNRDSFPETMGWCEEIPFTACYAKCPCCNVSASEVEEKYLRKGWYANDILWISYGD